MMEEEGFTGRVEEKIMERVGEIKGEHCRGEGGE